jgi:hypothetical protein
MTRGRKASQLGPGDQGYGCASIAKKAPEANEVVQTPVGLSVTFSEPVQNVTVNNLYIEGVTVR